MKRFAWIGIGPYGKRKIHKRKDGKRIKRVMRVYLVTLESGEQLLCHPDVNTDKWLYPVDGGAPIRRKRVVKFVDITEDPGTKLVGEARL